MSQALPPVDLRTAAGVSAALLYFWPVAVTVIMAVIRWRYIAYRVGFLVLGYLTCVGVGALVRQFGFAIYWTRIVTKVPKDSMVASLVDASLSITLLGTILSIAPVWWLARILNRHRDSSAT
jgi:hypothetical protein